MYLQTSLASVTSPSDQSDFLACMSHLLAARNAGPPMNSEDQTLEEQPEGRQGESGEDEDDEAMVVSQILPSKVRERDNSASVLNMASWKRRTEVFEDLLNFFSPEDKEPQDDLLSNSVAWEGLL